MPTITFAQAINEALREEMRRDKSIVIIGEEIGNSGGRFGVTKNLFKKFGGTRVFDTPINEEILVGIGTGAALGGLRPVVELMYASFLPIAMDDICRSGLWSYMHGGKIKIPLVVRLPICGYNGAGAEIAASYISFSLHIHGVKVVAPSTPYDAKGLLKTAIRNNGPVLFFEHAALYKQKGSVPVKDYLIPLGKASIMRKGDDITIIADSFMVDLSLKAAGALGQRGINAEVLDLRSLVPLDMETIIKSVSKTGRVVIVEEEIKRGGIGGEIGMAILENLPYNKKIKIKRVTAKNIPLPYGGFEKHILPNEKNIVNAVYELMIHGKKESKSAIVDR